MARPRELEQFLQVLIKNPDAMIVGAVDESGNIIPIPFVCNRTEDGNQAAINAAATFAQGQLGLDVDNDLVNPMEAEFPDCISCPAFSERVKPNLPKDTRINGFIPSAWSRNALTHRVPMQPEYPNYVIPPINRPSSN